MEKKSNIHSDNFLKHFSDDYSEEIKKFAIEGPLKFSRYIFTHRVKNQQYGYCTHCNREFKTQGLKHNEKTYCPHCNSEAKVKASGKGRKYMFDETYFVYYEKSLIDPNIITARGIYGVRDYSDDYRFIETKLSTSAYYIFKIGSPLMFRNLYWRKTYEQRKSVFSLESQFANSKIKVDCSYESIEKAIKNTPFQYSSWNLFKTPSEMQKILRNKDDMIKFFELYSKYPSVVECLAKSEFSNLIDSKLNGNHTYSSINWKANSLYKILKLNKDDIKYIKGKNISIDFNYLGKYQFLRKRTTLKIDEVLEISTSFLDLKDFKFIHKYSSIKKVYNYVNRQFQKQNNEKKVFYSPMSAFLIWRDYILGCNTLNEQNSDIEGFNIDITSKNVLFPKNVHEAHQNIIKQIKIAKDEKYDRLINKQYEKLKKYCYQNEKFLIRPAKDCEDLIKEGSALNHCVATNYTDLYANGKTNIFFVRKLDNIDRPYCTIEVKKNKLIQSQVKGNIPPNKETKAFIDSFIEFISTTHKIKKSA